LNTNENINVPLVTVLLPVHNGADYILSSVESILQQTFTDFEFLIIDDGSTDSTREIVSAIKDLRINLIVNEKNLGLIASLNKGISLAKGKYIARMDADDFALPDRLKRQTQIMESDSGMAVLATQIELINEDGDVTGKWSTDSETNSEAEIRSMMMRTNCIAHPSVMMRTEVAKHYLYKENQKGAEDWDLWMRILADGKRIAKIPDVLLKYRVHPASTMSVSKANETLEKRLMRVKWKFIWGQFLKLKFNGFYWGVKFSYNKNLARNIISNKLPHWGRDVKRLLTSPPWKVISEGKKFRNTLETYSGRHFFVFPYMHVGGAEKVHAAIAGTVAAEKPIVIFSGFSDNKKFLARFEKSGTVMDVAHYVNYPWTRKKAKRILSEKINSFQNSVFFGSNAGLFYDLIPSLNTNVKIIDLIHAFKYQPGANLAHLKLLALASRIDKRIFVSSAALEEFSKFEFHNNIPKRLRDRLMKIPNGIRIENGRIKFSGKTGILFVGRNSPEKRAEVFAELSMKIPEADFNLIGFSITDNSKVNYLGEITDENTIAKIYGQNDFLLVLSSREGFPMVIMEAMMNGLIVISTPVGDIPNHLNGENGILTSSVEPSVFIPEIVELVKSISENQERMMKIKTAARKYAIENFSEAKFEENYRKLLLN
jgi:glycosyltransferase involved in cell wall biosynthesis